MTAEGASRAVDLLCLSEWRRGSHHIRRERRSPAGPKHRWTYRRSRSRSAKYTRSLFWSRPARCVRFFGDAALYCGRTCGVARGASRYRRWCIVFATRACRIGRRQRNRTGSRCEPGYFDRAGPGDAFDFGRDGRGRSSCRLLPGSKRDFTGYRLVGGAFSCGCGLDVATSNGGKRPVHRRIWTGWPRWTTTRSGGLRSQPTGRAHAARTCYGGYSGVAPGHQIAWHRSS